MNERFARAASRIAGISAIAATLPLSAHACGMEPYIGEVCVFAIRYCPVGFVPANGATLLIQNNQALYALLGTLYGGDGRTTFAVPDLMGRGIVGTGTSKDSNVNPVTLGQKSGGSTVTPTQGQLTPHSHAAAVALAQGSIVNGPVTLPVTGGTVSGQTISGAVTVNALNGDNPPSGAKQVPDANTNTVGKVGGLSAFYPPGTTKVAVPSSHNLTVSGGSISGASASGNLVLPAADKQIPVGVGTAGAGAPVTITPPRLGLTVCIATEGFWPSQQ